MAGTKGRREVCKGRKRWTMQEERGKKKREMKRRGEGKKGGKLDRQEKKEKR